jgi:hypothetical protein
MDIQTWIALSADEQKDRCGALDPYKSWSLFKAVEAAFMQQHGNEQNLQGIFCGFANQVGPGHAINVYLTPETSVARFPVVFMGFPVLCLFRKQTSAALKPPRANVRTLKALLDEDDESPMDPKELDDQLWELLSERVTSIEEAKNYPRSAVLYVASRRLQWDVGNGGFAQAAYNIPEWFPLAAEGYQELGKVSSAQLIRKAIKLLPAEIAEIERKKLLSAAIDHVFEHFQSSQMAKLDSKIVEVDWYIDDERVAYVRQHRDTFRSIL